MKNLFGIKHWKNYINRKYKDILITPTKDLKQAHQTCGGIKQVMLQCSSKPLSTWKPQVKWAYICQQEEKKSCKSHIYTVKVVQEWPQSIQTVAYQ